MFFQMGKGFKHYCVRIHRKKQYFWGHLRYAIQILVVSY